MSGSAFVVPGDNQPRAPDRLHALVEIDQRRAISQPPVTVRHRAYVEKAPASLRHIVDALPANLDRASVDAFAAAHDGEPDAVLWSFIAGQVWGYNRMNNGPWRLAQSLAYPHILDTLTATRVALLAEGPLAGFRLLVCERGVPWCAMAFGTKALRFLHPRGRALILDRLVQRWLHKHSPVRVRLVRGSDHYQRFLAALNAWAGELDHPVERIEMLIFSDQARISPSWRVPELDALPAERTPTEPSEVC